MTVAPVADPAAEYQQRLDDRRARLRRMSSLDDRISTARGLVFLGMLAAFIAWYSSGSSGSGPYWAAAAFLLLAIFAALVVIHGVVDDRLKRARLATRFWERCLARIGDQWAGSGTPGDRYADDDHLYANDLDLFGRGSLFELLCQARTRLGEDALANWLRSPAQAKVIRERQQAIAELVPNVDLREQLAVLDAQVHDGVDQTRLIAWAAETARPLSWPPRITAVALALLTVVAFAALEIWGWVAPLSLMLVFQAVFAASYGRHIRRLARTANDAASGLAILAQVLEIVERERFESPLLAGIRHRLEAQNRLPSRQIARLEGLIGYLNNCLQNQFFAPIAFVIGLPVHLVHAIEVWRADVGPHIAEWLNAAGDFEALVCLAGFAYEHPDYPFPQIADTGSCFEAAQIGHPLIARRDCICNDVQLNEGTRLILISGSNMSGKSTLLRTVGTNLVLAQTGAPVRAKHLATSVFQIGTAMRIRDSLQSHESLFYAAVCRLKTVVEQAQHATPLLFLFDEILQGTNSHDRLIGSEGVLRALVERGAVGFVTTHDLALTEMVDRLGTKAINCHFEDSLVDGKMTFDYHIRPGVVQKSNALELMRLMGLDV